MLICIGCAMIAVFVSIPTGNGISEKDYEYITIRDARIFIQSIYQFKSETGLYPDQSHGLTNLVENFGVEK